jgi:hypothetical protein
MEILRCSINVIANLLGLYIIVVFCMWLRSKIR